MSSKTLRLRRPPDPSKVALAQKIGFRFVERHGNRYMLQVRVFYEEKSEHTWVDAPLVPETYGGAA